jgi:hypothetical protein
MLTLAHNDPSWITLGITLGVVIGLSIAFGYVFGRRR